MVKSDSGERAVDAPCAPLVGVRVSGDRYEALRQLPPCKLELGGEPALFERPAAPRPAPSISLRF